MKKVLDATDPKFKPLKCPLCENIYKDQEWLSHHLRTIHKGDMSHRNVTPAFNFIEASAEVSKERDSNNDIFTTDSLGRKIISEKVYPKTHKKFAQQLIQMPKKSIQCPLCKSKSIHENQEWLVHHLKTVHNAKGYNKIDMIDIESPSEFAKMPRLILPNTLQPKMPEIVPLPKNAVAKLPLPKPAPKFILPKKAAKLPLSKLSEKRPLSKTTSKIQEKLLPKLATTLPLTILEFPKLPEERVIGMNNHISGNISYIEEFQTLPEKRHFAQTDLDLPAEHEKAKKSKLSENNSSKCGVCGLTFSKKPDFVKHYKAVHAKKFFCSICSMNFASENHVHINSLQCSWCSLVFQSENGLKKHIQVKHRIQTMRPDAQVSVFNFDGSFQTENDDFRQQNPENMENISVNVTNENITLEFNNDDIRVIGMNNHISDTISYTEEIKDEVKEEWDQNDIEKISDQGNLLLKGIDNKPVRM